jgi:F-type H+-transporting ATPase subunit b
MSSYLLLAADSEDQPNPLLPHWSEVILVLIIFGLLFFLVRKFIVPQFEKTFEARRDAIEGGIARAEQAQVEAAAALANYQAQLADARGEAGQIREQARAEAQRIVEDLRSQAQAESNRIIARGEEQLAVQRAQVVRELRGEIGTLAVELAEKIVDQTLSDDARVRTTVDDFLADLEARDSAAASANGGAGAGAGS